MGDAVFKVSMHERDCGDWQASTEESTECANEELQRAHFVDFYIKTTHFRPPPSQQEIINKRGRETQFTAAVENQKIKNSFVSKAEFVYVERLTKYLAWSLVLQFLALARIKESRSERDYHMLWKITEQYRIEIHKGLFG